MACFFISFNSADLDWAEWLAWQLEDNGHTTVIQDWELTDGSDNTLQTDEAAAKADKIIAVLSPAYIEALYAQSGATADFAADPEGLRSKIIPIRVKECVLEGPLTDMRFIDITGLDEDGAQKLLLSKLAAEETVN